jgi:hypothetical protein
MIAIINIDRINIEKNCKDASKVDPYIATDTQQEPERLQAYPGVTMND